MKIKIDKPLDLEFKEIKIPENEVAEADFEMIVRALITDEREVDMKEEAYEIVFSLLEEFRDEFLDEVKQRIKSACEFYLRYKDNPELLMKEHPKYKDELFKLLGEASDRWIAICEFIGHERPIFDMRTRDKNDKYNELLFRLAFKSVLEEVKGK